MPFLLQGELGAIGLSTALSVSSTIVDVSPSFFTTGALPRQRARHGDDGLQPRALVYGAVIAAVGPLLAWLVMVAPGRLGCDKWYIR